MSSPTTGSKHRLSRTRERGRLVDEGVLAGHYREGRVFRPPIAAFAPFEPTDWLRDDLPDLMWPALLVARDGDEAARQLGRFQTAAFETVGPVAGVRVDGRLTSIEKVPFDVRHEIYVLRDEHFAVFPPELGTLAQMFPTMPGRWLFERWFDGESIPSETDCLNEIAGAILKMAIKGHLDALVRFMSLAWIAVSGTGSFGPQLVELLKDYPAVPAKFTSADTAIRAAYGAMRAAAVTESRDTFAPAAEWARTFWNHCWTFSTCMPASSRDADESGEDSSAPPRSLSSDDAPSDDELMEASSIAEQRVLDLFNVFLRSVLSAEANVDLFRPARFEVCTGLASRAARTTIAYIRNPEMWSSEHVANALRLLAESEILVRWMDREGDAAFTRYQEYGAGKRKLSRLHLEQLAQLLGDRAPSELDLAIQDQANKTPDLGGIDYQEVSVEASFAGRSLRQMADECGASDLYRYVYQQASAVVHGEWWTIEDAAMQRCLNPLHRFHLMPSYNAAGGVHPKMGDMLAARLADVCEVALEAIRAPSPEHAGS